MEHTRQSRRGRREGALEDFFGAEPLEATPLAPELEDGSALQPFGDAGLSDLAAEAPSDEPPNAQGLFDRALGAAAQQRQAEAVELLHELYGDRKSVV